MGVQSTSYNPSQPFLLAVITLIIVGALMFLCIKRETLTSSGTRAVPRGDSRLIIAAAAMLALSGILNRLMTQLYVRVAPQPSPETILFLITAGALLFFSGQRKWLPQVAALALTGAVGAFYNGSISANTQMLVYLSALLILWSAIGWRRNVVFKWLPQGFALPALNLISLVVTLFCIPAVAREHGGYIGRTDMIPILAYLYVLVRLLPLAGILLVNIASEAQSVPARAAPDMSTRSAPRSGTLFTVASWLLLVMGSGKMLRVMFTVYDPNALILTLPLVAAGVLLVLHRGCSKRFIAAVGCLFLSVALSFFNTFSYTTTDFWTYSFPILLMFISVIGAPWNLVPGFLSKITRAPILNILAAALLLIGIAANAADLAAHSALIADRGGDRKTSAARIAASAGKDAALAPHYMEAVEEAVAAFDELVLAAETALENARELMDEGEIFGFTTELEGAAAKVEEFELLIADMNAEWEQSVSAFQSDLSAISRDARDEFDSAAADIGDKTSAPGLPTAENAASAADSPRENEKDDPVQAAETARSEALAAERSVLYTAVYAAEGIKDALSAIDKASESIEAIAEAVRAETARLYTLMFSLLTSAGLVLHNLSLGSYEVRQRGAFAAFMRLCRRIFGWFYRDVGGKLQALAKIQAVCCMAIAILSALTAAVGLCGFLVNYFFTGAGLDYLVIFGAGIGGILTSFILALPTWLLYTFGQITGDVRELKESGGLSGPEYLEENPDDLPEL